MGLTKEKRFFIFWSVLGAIAILVIWHLPWRFQVNDDVIMMWLVSGAYTGEPESYAIFIHPILSWVFAKLYSLSPDVDWYGGTWFWVIGLSYFLLVKTISGWRSDQVLKNSATLFFLLMTIHFSFFPQFTIVSGFAAFSALVYWFSNDYKASPYFRTISIFLFLLACLIRWESLALMGLGLGTFQLITFGILGLRRNPIRFLLPVFLFIIIVGAKFSWERNSEYADFLKFNKLRASVIDHPVFRQEIIENQFSPGTDFYFFSRWYFESDFPSELQLVEKKKLLNQKLFTVNQLKSSFQRLWGFQKMEAFKSFIIFTILLLAIAIANKYSELIRFYAVWILFFFLFNHFFLLQGRVVVLFFLCFLLPIFNGFQIRFNPSILNFTIFIFLVLILFHSYNFQKEAKGRMIMDQEFIHLHSLVDINTPVILEGFQEHNSEIKYSSTRPVPFLTTGWISRSPFQKKALGRFGLKSFEEIQEYILITPTINLEIVFPSYMDYAFGEFQLLDSRKTDNFVFFHFKK